MSAVHLPYYEFTMPDKRLIFIQSPEVKLMYCYVLYCDRKIVETDDLQAHDEDVCQMHQLSLGCHSYECSLVQQGLHTHLLLLHTADLSILYNSHLHLKRLSTCRGRHSDDDDSDDDNSKCYYNYNYTRNITNFYLHY